MVLGNMSSAPPFQTLRAQYSIDGRRVAPIRARVADEHIVGLVRRHGVGPTCRQPLQQYPPKPVQGRLPGAWPAPVGQEPEPSIRADVLRWSVRNQSRPKSADIPPKLSQLGPAHLTP
jgi:hypothetical protein